MKTLLIDLRDAVYTLKCDMAKQENYLRLALRRNTELRKALEETVEKMPALRVASTDDESTKEFWVLRSTQLEKERHLWVGLCVALVVFSIEMWFRIPYSVNQ